MCTWHVLKMMATAHDALRYRDIVRIIPYHFNALPFIVHQMFLVNGKDRLVWATLKTIASSAILDI